MGGERRRDKNGLRSEAAEITSVRRRRLFRIIPIMLIIRSLSPPPHPSSPVRLWRVSPVFRSLIAPAPRQLFHYDKKRKKKQKTNAVRQRDPKRRGTRASVDGIVSENVWQSPKKATVGKPRASKRHRIVFFEQFTLTARFFPYVFNAR